MQVKLMAAALMALAGTAEAKDLCLAENGRTDYRIVVDAAAPQPVRFAAEELQAFLKESTGADFPIVSEAAGRTIEVGTEKARAIVSKAYPRPFKVETSAAVADGETLALWGAGEAGHAYAVYQFLEKVVGCRWFTEMGENLVPKHPTLTVGDLRLIERPKLDFRMLLTHGGEWDKDSNRHLFLFRNRINQQEGNFEAPVRKDLKGKLPVRMRENRPNCHSFFRYMPPSKYFKDHPEYYSLGKDGKRVVRQLCFANPGLRAELTKNFLAYAGSVGGKGFLDLSQEDMGGAMCECEQCKAMSAKYASNGGPLFDYLLELSPAAMAKYPELVIHTLVYHRDSTQKPPKTARPFPDNIAVVFAPLDDDFSKPLDHKNNLESLEHLRGWTKICKVWTWSYPSVYTTPRTVYANLSRSAADVRIGIEAGLSGSYHEHDVGTDAGCNFADLQTWMLTQHFRFPDRDWRALRKEFCDFYYGAASEQVVAYEEFIEKNLADMDYYLTFLSRPDGYIKPGDIVRLQGDFDAMERAVGGDPVYVQRLREVRAGLDMLTLVNWKDLERQSLAVPGGLDGVYERAMDSRRKAIARRWTLLSEKEREVKASQGFGEQLKSARTMATLNVKPLPEDVFGGIPEEKINQIVAETMYLDIEKVDMPDAAAGYAHVERKARHAAPFSVGFYDSVGKKTLLNSPIAAKDIVPNEFHFYKLGRCGIPSANCYVWMGHSWKMNQMCSRLFRPGMDEDWDVYVSLKFEGPAYDKASTLKESNVYFDRLVLVGPFARTEDVELPGEKTMKPAISPAPFPDRMSAYVWRNWGLVPVAKLAEVVGATPQDLTSVAADMGLAADPVVLPEWKTKGYITVLRRNWHLLPYGQLTTLLGKTRAELYFSLMEDDFLWVKLGRVKPFCEELKWNGGEVEKWSGARKRLAAILKEECLDPNAPEEPRFAFVKDLATPNPQPQPSTSTSRSPFDFRLIFSYFADYGDPLGDPEIGSFPEGLLQKLSAQGVNAVWLHTVLRTLAKDPKYPEFGEGSEKRIANLKKLVARAEKHGIRVFLYMNEPRAMPASFFERNAERRAMKGACEGELFAMCTACPETLRWLRDSLAQVFSQVPGLGGIFTITMSENLTNCAARGTKKTCPRCKDRKAGDLVVEQNRAMIEGMVRGNPKAEAVLYTWAWPKDEEEYIVRHLPKHNLRLMTVSENAMPICRGGVETEELDYSISVVGPGENARRMWGFARAAGVPAVAKVQAANSWELSSFPYLPVMDLVAQHAVNLSKEGVNGVMLSWSLGCCPSPNLAVYRDLAKGETEIGGVLDRMAAQLYGAANVSRVRQAWKAFSEGFANYPFSCSTIYNGPQQWGPANPLYAQKTGWRATMVGIPYDALDSWRAEFPADVYAELMGRVADGFAEGCRLLEGVAPKRELDMFRAEQMHFASCRDQVRFVMARDRGDGQGMRWYAKAELARAKAYWPLVRADSRIGYESSNHYFFVPRDLLEKVLSCRQAMRR